MLIQNLWCTCCDWNEAIDNNRYEKMTKKDFVCHYFENDVSYDSLENPIFVSAREEAYGCVAYFRVVIDGFPRCSLVQTVLKTTLRVDDSDTGSKNGRHN